MLNKILISFVLLVMAAYANADEIKINPDHPDNYTVVKGDTLWDISARFLEEPWRWPEIWNVNPQIANPHLIYPGDIISLSYQDGAPVLSVNRGSVVNGRNVKLSPEIRYSDNEEAIKTIPIDAIQQFLERPLVLEENEMKYWPYVVSSYDEHLISTTGNTIYIRGDLDEDTSKYSIYRMGEPYINPNNEEDDEVLGYEAIYVGDAIIEKRGDPASAIVTSVDREVLNGDRLLPQSNTDVNSEFIPKPPLRDVDGQILSVVDGVSQIGQYQIIVLNLGLEEGIEPGNVLGIYQSGKVVKDKIGPNISKSPEEKAAERQEIVDNGTIPEKIALGIKEKIEFFDEAVPYISNKQAKEESVQLPEEYVGVAMVFRTFNKVSYALVMETAGAVHVNDKVKSM